MIRLATHDDIEQLIQMRWDFTYEDNDATPKVDWEGYHRECEQFLQQALQGDRWYIWVAEIDNIVVSHIYVELIDKVPRPGRVTHPFGYVTNVYTRPEYRGQGIGSKLLSAIEQWAREINLEFLIVWPSSTSVNFYERNGYALAKEAMELHLK